MNAIRRLIRFILGIVLFGCVVWGVVVLISGGDMAGVNSYLIPTFVFYFMFDVVIRLTDLEKRMKAQEARDYEIIFSVSSMTCKPNLPKSEPKPETEEGKETT
jgi:peptidoglycan/LPS O-acetylase OafA/YrhL